jgi:hypothetical protein
MSASVRESKTRFPPWPSETLLDFAVQQAVSLPPSPN